MYKLSKTEIIDLVSQYCDALRETADRLGEEIPPDFLSGPGDRTITAETIANQAEQLAATIRVYTE
jgi:hypothetical protein